MQFKRFINKPNAVLSFTKQEIELLVLESARHYDRACKEAGVFGGIIFSLATEVEWAIVNDDDATVEKRLTFNEVDLLAKVVEPISALDQISPKLALHHQLMIVLQMLNAEHTRINSVEISPKATVADNG